MKHLWLYLGTPLLLLPVTLHADDRVPTTLPNIVFILADDLGINDLGCYGRSEHHTPNLDRLAADGMRLTSAYCALPICSASRAAIMSGKNPARLHLTTFLPGRPDCPSQQLLHPVIRQQLPLEETTLAEHLKAAGYATACIGKWHLGGAGFGPREQGFDVYHPGQAVTTPSDTEGGKGEYDLTAQAEKFIEASRDRPFFLYLAHNSPHIPYSAKEKLVAENHGAFEPAYAAVIESLDDTVGQLLRRLDALGLAANTIVIFTSDNGGLHVPELSHERITHNAPYRAGKGFLHEGGLRSTGHRALAGACACRASCGCARGEHRLAAHFTRVGRAVRAGQPGRRQPQWVVGRSQRRAAACVLLALPALHEPREPARGRSARWRLEANRVLRRPTSGIVQSGRGCRRDDQSCRART